MGNFIYWLKNLYDVWFLNPPIDNTDDIERKLLHCANHH